MKTGIFFFVCGVFVFLSVTKAVFAAPAVNGISGTVSSGQTVTISGTSFGIKSLVQPLLWDTFESGTNGAYVGTNAATIGQWETGAGSGVVKYSSAQPHAGNMSSWLHFYPTLYNISLSQNKTFSKVYMEFWMYVDYSDIKSSNFKPWRFYGFDGDDLMTYRYGFGCNYQNTNINDSACTFSKNTYWYGSTYNNRTWYHYQVYFQESNPAQSANGRAIQYVNGTKDWDLTVQTRCSDSRHLDQLRIGHYWATGDAGSCPANSGADIYFDNVYIDNGTWAHVELGNNVTYDSSTKREVQIPTAWSNNAITISVNQSSFINGETAYLYVVDDNGVMNTTGYPVTIGGSSSSPTPCHTVTPANFSQATYNSYGAPFDPFTGNTPLLNVTCNSADTDTITLTTGVTGDTTRIVYTKGYWYDAVTTGWRQYAGTCTGALNGDWCQGSVSATITDANVSTASAANPTYFVGMTCSVQGGSWKCGCRDTTCNNFLWQIQGAGL